MYLSAVLKSNGHVCDVAFFSKGQEKILSSVKEFQPDIIGFSLITVNQELVLTTAAFLKKNNVNALIIVGGPHPTFFPDFINNECIDIINRGEGEYSLLDLANAIDNGSDITGIQNLYVKKNGKIYKNSLRPLVDVDQLPHPDIDIYLKHLRFKGSYTVIASRGCPFQCSFCFFHKWNELYKTYENKNTIRLKSIDKCLNEISNSNFGFKRKN